MPEPTQPRITYRDYMLWKTANAMASLADAIRVALDMQDDWYAVEHLEAKLRTIPELVSGSPNPEVVGPRPTEPRT